MNKLNEPEFKIGLSDIEILERMDFNIIEKFVRDKKLKKINYKSK